MSYPTIARLLRVPLCLVQKAVRENVKDQSENVDDVHLREQLSALERHAVSRDTLKSQVSMSLSERVDQLND